MVDVASGRVSSDGEASCLFAGAACSVSKRELCGGKLHVQVQGPCSRFLAPLPLHPHPGGMPRGQSGFDLGSGVMDAVLAAVVGAVSGALAAHLTAIARQRRQRDSELRSAARLMSKALRMLTTAHEETERRFLLTEIGPARDVLSRHLADDRWELVANALEVVVHSSKEVPGAAGARRLAAIWDAVAMLDDAGYVPLSSPRPAPGGLRGARATRGSPQVGEVNTSRCSVETRR